MSVRTKAKVAFSIFAFSAASVAIVLVPHKNRLTPSFLSLMFWKKPFLLPWMYLTRLIPNGPWLSLLHFYIFLQHHSIQLR